MQTNRSYCAAEFYSKWGIISDPQPVDHCLSQKVDEKCQFLFSFPICLAVILCNTIKVICMLLTAYGKRKQVFLTTGDVISSFMGNPDVTTRGRCLLSRLSITGGLQLWPMSLGNKGLPTEDPAQPPHKKRWVKAISTLNWMGTIPQLGIFSGRV